MKKKKLASTFNWIVTALSVVGLILLFVFAMIILQNSDGSFGTKLGGVLWFALGLIICGVGGAAATALSVVTCVLFKKDIRLEETPVGHCVLSTVAKVLWLALFTLFAIVTITFGGNGIALGCVAVAIALFNVATCVFDWLARKAQTSPSQEEGA